MAREFEIKLEIPASTVGKVMRLPWLWELASGELHAAHMISTYYDTPDLALRKRGITLRVRRVGARCVQTIKSAVNGAALPVDRYEWEEDVATIAPELERAAGTPLAEVPKRKLKGLQQCFEVHIDRSAFPIQSANSAIEVAIDRTQIVAGDATTSFCEVELELKRGASSELARIARRIASEVPASFALKTKSDRGFGLREAKASRAQRAEPVALSPTTRVGEAFQAIGWSCLRHFVLNADVVCAGDTEGVHQMRVGLRRLRSAIALFKHMLDGPETDAVKAELAWLAAELGPARELDVLLEDWLAPLCAAQAEQAALVALCEDIAERRQAALARAGTALASDRFRQLSLRVALWLIAAEWSDKAQLAFEDPSRRVAAFADRALLKSTRRVTAKLARFAELDVHGRHKLRIAVKQLRYATEFFADVVDDHGREAFFNTVHHLQHDLGRLNDMATHERLRDAFMTAWTQEQGEKTPQSIQKAFAIGFALGQQEQERDACLAAIERERGQLMALKPFWR